ncbi:tetratricopeptide repeat protein [Vibrio sp. LaRot3]|uniref:tetratricopeptide repeat protein n=1 Tax=Vibrio sp. LaRot3 TaxID=2998829 RepID=UPI0022CDEF6F|nr:hypothetical protein [Vibrio sp. LaRot3]MDA0149575.1 hypothetical protein [Vibrio sp. LaRot3]
MDLQQCWTHYLKAEQLLEQGHWPEAHYLFEQVLSHMPEHVHAALNNKETKPCQFSCLVTGIRDASVSQSQILNRMGQHQEAFDTLNQTYALLQFISIEPSDLVRTTDHILRKHSEDLLRHMGAFCSAQRNAQWMLEFEQVQKAHHHFDSLKYQGSNHDHSHVIN